MTAAESKLRLTDKHTEKAFKNKNFFGSVKHAAYGMYACFKEERNFLDYTLISGTALVLNILLGSVLWEYIVLIIVTTGSFSAEYINTAIERIIDNYSGEVSEVNKFIKDAAAAGVLAFGAAFFLCEGLILIPKIAEAIGR